MLGRFFRNNKVIIFVIIIIILLKLFIIRELHNRDWEPDGYLHVLYANSIFENFPSSLKLGIEVWAKPLYTYIYGFISMMVGDKTISFYQMLNVLVWSLVSLITYLIVNKLASRKIAVFLSVLSSITFIVFRSSMTALTEPIFTFSLLLSIYFFSKNKYLLSTFFIALLPLGRIEGLMFAGIWGIFLLFRAIKKRISIKRLILFVIILILPTLIWNFFGYLVTKSPFFIFSNGYPLVLDVYGKGNWFSYLYGFLIQDPISLFMLIIGIVTLVIMFVKRRFNPIIGISTIYAVMLLAANIIFWNYGLFGTAGLMRYFVPIIPLMLISASKFLNSDRMKTLTKSYFLFAVIILQLIFTLGSMYVYKGWFMNLVNYPYVPEEIISTGNYIKYQVFSCDVFSNQPSILYYSGRNLLNSRSLFDQQLTDPNLNKDFILAVEKTWEEKWGVNQIILNKYHVYPLRTFGNINIYLFDTTNDNSNCSFKIN